MKKKDLLWNKNYHETMWLISNLAKKLRSSLKLRNIIVSTWPPAFPLKRWTDKIKHQKCIFRNRNPSTAPKHFKCIPTTLSLTESYIRVCMYTPNWNFGTFSFKQWWVCAARIQVLKMYIHTYVCFFGISCRFVFFVLHGWQTLFLMFLWTTTKKPLNKLKNRHSSSSFFFGLGFFFSVFIPHTTKTTTTNQFQPLRLFGSVGVIVCAHTIKCHPYICMYVSRIYATISNSLTENVFKTNDILNSLAEFVIIVFVVIEWCIV